MRVFTFLTTISLAAAFTFTPRTLATQADFLNQVNSAWIASNYDQIQQLATVEATATPPDPAAFVILYDYYVLIVGNTQQAIAQLNSLVAVLQAVQPSAVSAVQQYRDQFVAVTSGNPGTPRTASQLAQLHFFFPTKFPAQTLLSIISAGN